MRKAVYGIGAWAGFWLYFAGLVALIEASVDWAPFWTTFIFINFLIFGMAPLSIYVVWAFDLGDEWTPTAALITPAGERE